MPSFGRVLFLGIGGGNDIFSCTLAASSLYADGWRWKKCAFAGVLSPFHYHTVKPTGIGGLFLTQPSSERHLLRRQGARAIRFVDSAVSAFVASGKPFDCTGVYGISLMDGSMGVAWTLKQLVPRLFDYVVLVDVGGDCFYRGSQDTHVLSPFFDATVLRGFIDARVRGVLFEAGPGTDGELEPEALASVLQSVQATSNPLRESMIDQLDAWYRQWVEPVRPGRTVSMTISAFRSPEHMLTVRYRARAHLGATRRYAYFDQRIDTELCRSYYVVDPSRISNPLAIESRSPIDWFIKTQLQGQHVNNETNLEYWARGNQIVHLLTPSPLLDANDRRDLIAQGIDELAAGVCDEAWLLPGDQGLVDKLASHRVTSEETETAFILRRC